MLALGFLVITRQPQSLESFSNPLQMREDFLVLLKKKFFDSGEGFTWGGSQSGGAFGFLTNFDGPWKPIPWAKILAQTIFEN